MRQFWPVKFSEPLVNLGESNKQTRNPTLYSLVVCRVRRCDILDKTCCISSGDAPYLCSILRSKKPGWLSVVETLHQYLSEISTIFRSNRVFFALVLKSLPTPPQIVSETNSQTGRLSPPCDGLAYSVFPSNLTRKSHY